MSTQKNSLAPKSTNRLLQKSGLATKVISRLPELVKPVKKLTGDAKKNFDIKQIAKPKKTSTAKTATRSKKILDIKRVIRPKNTAKASFKPKKSTPAKKVIASAQPKITKEDLINAESAIGGQLFGPIPQGHRREFFLYRHNYWIFHESWLENGQRKESTIIYDVRKNGVYKNPLGKGYRKVTGAELKNFCLAVKEYQKLVKAKLYQK